MSNLNVGIARLVVPEQLLCHVYRAVLAAGAADRYRQVAAVIGLKFWQPLVEKGREVLVHFRKIPLYIG